MHAMETKMQKLEPDPIFFFDLWKFRTQCAMTFNSVSDFLFNLFIFSQPVLSGQVLVDKKSVSFNLLKHICDPKPQNQS